MQAVEEAGSGQFCETALIKHSTGKIQAESSMTIFKPKGRETEQIYI